MNRFSKGFWIALVGIVAWLAASFVAFVSNDPSQFQRAGTLGIAAGIALFGLQRSRLSENNNSLILLKVSMAVRELEAEILETKMEGIESLSLLNSHLSANDELSKKTTQRAAEFAEKLEYMRVDRSRRSKDLSQATVNLSKLERTVIFTEFSVLCLATLQTGYGDLIILALAKGN